MRIPGPKWGAGRPLWKPPSPRWRGKFGRTPRRLRGWSFGAVGEGRERLRARHGCRTSTASVLGASPPSPLPFPLGYVCRSCAFEGFAPWPPAFPVRERLPVMRVWGLRPLAPAFPKGESPPIMRASAWDNVRNGFCGNAFANLPEAPAA